MNEGYSDLSMTSVESTEVESKQEVDKSSSSDLLKALQQVLECYLNEKSSRSLNGLSKRCTVSEPTLRRILRGQIKTLPTSTTILDILTNLSGEKNTGKLAELYPGVIAEYLNTIIPQSQDCETEYDTELNNELKDGVKYIIYKLSSNSCGLPKAKLLDLFGSHGEKVVGQLIDKGYLFEKNAVYFSQVQNFTINQENFIANFKIIADFIKIQSPSARSLLQPLLANYSESVSLEAYKEIVALQKNTLRKIRKIMSQEGSKGSVPLFLLLAVDTFDSKSAGEFED